MPDLSSLTKVWKLIDSLDSEALVMLEAAIQADAFSGPLAPLKPFAAEALMILRFLNRVEALLASFGFGGKE